VILFDTDVCIEILRGNRHVLDRWESKEMDPAVSFMTVAELYYGAERSKYREENIVGIEKMLLAFDVVESNLGIEKRYASLKAYLESLGTRLADADLLVAATCLEFTETLVMGNQRHYERIPGLKIENWIDRVL
jgi:tRNA(fMet)-specific endonuclease VapC